MAIETGPGVENVLKKNGHKSDGGPINFAFFF